MNVLRLLESYNSPFVNSKWGRFGPEVFSCSSGISSYYKEKYKELLTDEVGFVLMSLIDCSLNQIYIKYAYGTVVKSINVVGKFNDLVKNSFTEKYDGLINLAYFNSINTLNLLQQQDLTIFEVDSFSNELRHDQKLDLSENLISIFYGVNGTDNITNFLGLDCIKENNVCIRNLHSIDLYIGAVLSDNLFGSGK